ncbi:hypothetical protein MTR67_008167 [Solanum verrucosum]|uniref:t-SNARE coiled-coil homology domain-containing protein n=1 Tax=Solanum verrucosum TaxID=315347 RepID=A0AAF0TC71_SOLVR|nr:hypothetical protein MTR67_008167 [Solanum verrucosum]
MCCVLNPYIDTLKFLKSRVSTCLQSHLSLLSMASSSHRGGDFYGAASHRSRDGLSTRPVGGSDEIQLRIDPMHGDLDDEITGLRKQVKQLRNVAQEIESEAKYQNDFINQLVCHELVIPFPASNDVDQSSSRSKEQHEKVEQEYHPGRIKPCDACGAFCTILLLCDILVGQIFTEIRTTLSFYACLHPGKVLMKTQSIQTIKQMLSTDRLVIGESKGAALETPIISLM